MPKDALSPNATGRGGPQHKYLQQLIKRLGESNGYRATIEKPVLGGQGSVDVSLERDGRRIACEIGISTTPVHELENIQKCLAAGYDQVVWLSTNGMLLRKVKSLVSGGLAQSTASPIHLLEPEEFVEFLGTQLGQNARPEKSETTTVRGYKVKVRYEPGKHGDDQTRKQVIAKTILKAFQQVGKK